MIKGSARGSRHVELSRAVCSDASLQGTPSRLQAGAAPTGKGMPDWRARCLEQSGECFALWDNEAYETLASFSYLPRSEIVLFTLPKAGDAASQWAFVESLPFEICALTSPHHKSWYKTEKSLWGSRGSTSITAGHAHFAAQGTIGSSRVAGSTSDRGA